ncbi:MAG: (2Fe-2S)-binding protein [Planctomycetes bacterium]|nr:(2Fe-2S)-binding protein [Planctomycetota bacterium]
MNDQRLPGTAARPEVAFTFEGRTVTARAGDSLAMALWTVGDVALRQSSRDGAARGVWCNMGICYECLVVVDGVTVRACTTLVRAGMDVRRGGKP